MKWYLSHRANPRAATIADRHYNRQKIGSPQFVPPGRCLVLLTEAADALWVTSYPEAQSPTLFVFCFQQPTYKGRQPFRLLFTPVNQFRWQQYCSFYCLLSRHTPWMLFSFRIFHTDSIQHYSVFGKLQYMELFGIIYIYKIVCKVRNNAMRRDRNTFTGEDQECSSCGKIKPLSDFPQDKSRIGGVRGQCKVCRDAYVSQLRSVKNPPILAALRAEAIANLKEYQKCVKCEKIKPLSEFTPHPTSRTGISKKCRACIQKDAEKENPISHMPRYHRHRALLYEYGISYADYQRMFQQQGGVCAICGRAETRKIRGQMTDLCVDHDHVSGKIRALLCAKCNSAIGQLEDNIDTAIALVEYLKRHRRDEDGLVLNEQS